MSLYDEASGLQFHSNLYLYALVAPNPVRTRETTVENDCVMETAHVNGDHGIMTFLSPVDAWLYFGNQDPKRGVSPVRFETVNVQSYLQMNHGKLIIFITRGYAATADKLLTKANGELIPIIAGDQFHLPEDVCDHFTIHFSQRVLDQLQDNFDAFGVHSFPAHLLEMREWSTDESWQASRSAVKCMPDTKTMSDDGDEMTHIAFYDSVALEWHFKPFA